MALVFPRWFSVVGYGTFVVAAIVAVMCGIVAISGQTTRAWEIASLGSLGILLVGVCCRCCMLLSFCSM